MSFRRTLATGSDFQKLNHSLT